MVCFVGWGTWGDACRIIWQPLRPSRSKTIEFEFFYPWKSEASSDSCVSLLLLSCLYISKFPMSFQSFGTCGSLIALAFQNYCTFRSPAAVSSSSSSSSSSNSNRHSSPASGMCRSFEKMRNYPPPPGRDDSRFFYHYYCT